jgi:hypothetical protein
MDIDELKHSFSKLLDTYKSDKEALKKIENVICNSLPNKIKECEIINIQRQNRKDYLHEVSEKFINNFLGQKENMYFYISNSNIFINYDGCNYNVVSEDQVWYQILNKISSHKNKNLSQWKYKIKNSVIKKIKDRNLLKSIPESTTIQSVLQYVCSTLLIEKDHAKYILTIIGDNLLKKDISHELLYFTEPKFKKWFQMIGDMSFFYFKYSKNPIDNIKFKFYNHDFEKCRLLQLKNMAYQNDLDENNYINQNGLNLLCVASHYSTRYQNSENFLNNHCNKPMLIDKIWYLKNNSIDRVLNNFKMNYIEVTDDPKLFVREKDLLFLWKDFLQNENLPQIIFLQEMKNLMKQHLSIEFDEINNFYLNITSTKLTIIQNFSQFMSQHIEFDSSKTEECEFIGNELELSEIVVIYNHYLKENNKSYLYYLDEYSCKNILNLLYNIEVVDYKYINGITCNLWDKRQDIRDFIETFNCKYDISLYDLYNEYCMNCDKVKKTFIVSKLFFDKFVYDIISDDKIEDNLISCEFWND